MVTLREVTFGLYGAWRLARLDRTAMTWFDRSVMGAWHSFWSAAICFPGFVILQLIQLSGAQIGAGDLIRFLVVASISYVIGWTAYPLTALPFCRRFATEERALGFIIAYNWSQALQTALVLAVTVIGALHLFPDYVVAYAETVSYIAILVYEWFIARIALEASGLAATALVLLDVVLTALLTQATMMLAG
ncbi:MAG TPA: hypothetical protein VMU87_05380 [Stellaceae bacterium]|nr:hypothetical protein [Stellaceae bacterium]